MKKSGCNINRNVHFFLNHFNKTMVCESFILYLPFIHVHAKLYWGWLIGHHQIGEPNLFFVFVFWYHTLNLLNIFQNQSNPLICVCGLQSYAQWFNITYCIRRISSRFGDTVTRTCSTFCSCNSCFL